jgi:hypothetical protein
MISTSHVQQLLESDQPDATLVLIEGRVEVIGAHSDSAAYRGALTVISRDDLIERIGETPCEHDLVAQTSALDAAITEMGG